jgi:hypothetical protein
MARARKSLPEAKSVLAQYKTVESSLLNEKKDA